MVGRVSSGAPVAIYDTTLRDGTQREGISLACADKLRIAQQLGLSHATVSRVLRRLKLNRIRHIEPQPPPHRYEHAAPLRPQPAMRSRTFPTGATSRSSAPCSKAPPTP